MWHHHEYLFCELHLVFSSYWGFLFSSQVSMFGLCTPAENALLCINSVCPLYFNLIPYSHSVCEGCVLLHLWKLRHVVVFSLNFCILCVFQGLSALFRYLSSSSPLIHHYPHKAKQPPKYKDNTTQTRTSNSSPTDQLVSRSDSVI